LCKRGKFTVTADKPSTVKEDVRVSPFNTKRIATLTDTIASTNRELEGPMWRLVLHGAASGVQGNKYQHENRRNETLRR